MDLLQKAYGAELPTLAREEIRRHVQAAWRMRSERRAGLLLALFRGPGRRDPGALRAEPAAQPL